MQDMTIGALARAAGIGVETIRFYQRRGLIEQPPRAGKVRRYGPGDLRTLFFIRKAQSAGFSLAEIKELIALDSSRDRRRAFALASAKIALLDARIAELEQARAALSRLAQQCGAATDGPCPIIASFETRSV